jgi:hypothetical protein
MSVKLVSVVVAIGAALAVLTAAAVSAFSEALRHALSVGKPFWIRVVAFAGPIAAGTAIAAFAATRPDPTTQAQADGCGRDAAAIFRKEEPTWVYVGDAGRPAAGPPPAPQAVSGVVDTRPTWLGAHPSDVDDPVSHSSFDFVFNVKPDSSGGFLLGTGNFAGVGEAEEAGRLHVEWEQAAFPPFAWPSAGDRVDLHGSWVWDCGHWSGGGERTELHPVRAFWVERQGVSARSASGEREGDLVISTDGTPAAASANCAHRTKGDPAAFKSCLDSDTGWQDVNGSYRFALRAPPRPTAKTRMRVRVVDAGSTPGAPAVRAAPGLNGAVVTVDVSAPAGRRVVVAKRVFVGWDTSPRPVHLRVTFDRILVRRAMDPGCNPPCTSNETTRTGQITNPPGEWVLYSNVAGIWQPWPLLSPVDNQTIQLHRSVDVYVGRRQAWSVLVTGRECDNGSLSAHSVTVPPSPCPAGTGEFLDLVGDDAPGTVADRYSSPAAALGEHRSNARLEHSSCPPVNAQGCYRVTYTVKRVG